MTRNDTSNEEFGSSFARNVSMIDRQYRQREYLAKKLERDEHVKDKVMIRKYQNQLRKQKMESLWNQELNRKRALVSFGHYMYRQELAQAKQSQAMKTARLRHGHDDDDAKQQVLKEYGRLGYMIDSMYPFRSQVLQWNSEQPEEATNQFLKQHVDAAIVGCVDTCNKKLVRKKNRAQQRMEQLQQQQEWYEQMAAPAQAAFPADALDAYYHPPTVRTSSKNQRTLLVDTTTTSKQTHIVQIPTK